MFAVAEHEQYLREPGDAVQWMVRIDRLQRQADRDRERAQRGY